MPPLVSVIVPMCNSGEYLEECLDSLVKQTLPDDLYEIILVDDKSSDNSLETARAYERRHGNVRVIALPERTPGGPGVPSNIGMNAAGGKYVGFLDHDDSALPEMFEKLAAAAEAEGADVTFCSFTVRPTGTTASYPPYDSEYWEKVLETDFPSRPLIEQKKACLKLAPAPWRKLYKLEYLRRNNIRFPVSEFLLEDMSFHWRVIVPAEKLARIGERLVLYKTKLPTQTTSMPLERAVTHQLHQLGDIKAFLVKAGLWDAYHNNFAHSAGELLNCVPETHPLYDGVKDAMAGLVETPAM